MTGIRHSMRLPHDEADETKRYSMADPDALAQSYMALTTYELGQEHCVGKLRDIWRARRARKDTP